MYTQTGTVGTNWQPTGAGPPPGTYKPGPVRDGPSKPGAPEGPTDLITKGISHMIRDKCHKSGVI